MTNDQKDYAVFVGFLILVSVIFFAVGYGFSEDKRAKVGGDYVPRSLQCEEDEFIGYDPTDQVGPRPLTCVNYEVLEGR